MVTRLHHLVIICFIFMSASSLFAQNAAPYWSTSGNSNATATSKLGTTNNIPLRILTNNAERMHIDGSGKIGIGNTAPKGQLTIQSGGGAPAASWVSSGVPLFAGFGENTPGNADDILAMASNTASARAVFLGRKSRGTLAAPKAVQGNDYLLSLYSSGYDGGSFQAPASVDFLVDGSVSSGHVPTRISLSTGSGFGDRTERLTVGSTGDVAINTSQLVVQQQNGDVGIGTATPGAYKLNVHHGAFGLNLANASTGDHWEFFTLSNLYLYANGSAKGSFNSSTGAYSTISDARLKQHIKPMDSILPRVKQLKPSTYQFKNVSDTQQYNGFIAQEVMKLFPSLVTHTVIPERNVDLYTMDYSGFGVLAIKAIQEFAPLVEKQQATITVLEDRITKLETALAAFTEKDGMGIMRNSGSAFLDQNYPNPVNAHTLIRYSVPANTRDARVTIVNAKGQVVQTITLSDRGAGQFDLNTSSLSAGAYTYTLYVNQQRIDSRQFIIAR